MLTPTSPVYFFFFFNDTATTEIYTLSLHDALPIYKAEKAAPPSVLDDDIRPEGGTRHRQRRRTQMRDLLRRDALEHIAEEIPETCPRPRPGQPARTGIEERSEEHTSELQSLAYLVCRLLLEKKKKKNS